jgi:hypothetical protein
MATHVFFQPKIITTIVGSIKVTISIEERMPVIATNVHYGSMTMVPLKKMASYKRHLFVILAVL